jgi:hypothetical protein
MADSDFQEGTPRPRRPRPPQDEDDDRPRRPPRRRRRDEDEDGGGDEVVSTLIPYKNGQALAAYYCGIFGLIPCVGLVLGPAALVLGVLGLRKAKANPRAKGGGHAIAGIVLGSLVLLGHLAVIALMVIGAMSSRSR